MSLGFRFRGKISSGTVSRTTLVFNVSGFASATDSRSSISVIVLTSEFSFSCFSPGLSSLSLTRSSFNIFMVNELISNPDSSTDCFLAASRFSRRVPSSLILVESSNNICPMKAGTIRKMAV
eukprot:Lithocolla_globosa_v1_NODE_472_length_3961_cov_18.488735.p3 type:complete len:122 gc:universal NODE_472_length_3961_cov_18.488735:3223-2858(-)